MAGDVLLSPSFLAVVLHTGVAPVAPAAPAAAPAAARDADAACLCSVPRLSLPLRVYASSEGVVLRP